MADEGKPPTQLGDMLQQILKVAQEDPDEVVRSVKGAAEVFSENSQEFQRRARNSAIQWAAKALQRRLFPEDPSK